MVDGGLVVRRSRPGRRRVIHTSAELTSTSWSEVIARPTCVPTSPTPCRCRAAPLPTASVTRSISVSEVPGAASTCSSRLRSCSDGQQRSCSPSCGIDREAARAPARRPPPTPAAGLPGRAIAGEPAVEEPPRPTGRAGPARRSAGVPRSSSDGQGRRDQQRHQHRRRPRRARKASTSGRVNAVVSRPRTRSGTVREQHGEGGEDQRPSRTAGGRHPVRPGARPGRRRRAAQVVADRLDVGDDVVDHEGQRGRDQPEQGHRGERRAPQVQHVSGRDRARPARTNAPIKAARHEPNMTSSSATSRAGSRAARRAERAAARPRGSSPGGTPLGVDGDARQARGQVRPSRPRRPW